MKKILAILVALLCCCTSVFANEQEAVSSFTAMINKIQAGIERTYTDEYARTIFYNHIGRWSKYRRGNAEISYDVKRTDSLVSPYKGILTVWHDEIVYVDTNNPEGEFKTEAEALNANIKKIKRSEATQFIYSYQNNQWVIKKYRFTMLDTTSEYFDKTGEDAILFPIKTCSNKK